MPVGSIRAGLGGKNFPVAISASTSNINLRTVANTAGYPGSGNCTLTINSGVDIWSASTGTAALVPGSWPAGTIVTLIVNGTVSGCGGNGGNGSGAGAGGPGGAGGAGGTALDATAVSGFTFKIDNTSGTLRGGGGGGGGGSYIQATGCDVGPGGGGGGGQGHNGGSGGSPGAQYIQGAASPGGSGSTGAAGAGGAGGADCCYGGGGYSGGAGGNGGAFGAAGSTGVSGNVFGPGAGGAAGKSVNGNSNLTWIATGTRTGPVA